MKTYLKNGSGFIALTFYQDGAPAQIHDSRAKYLLLSKRMGPSMTDDQLINPRRRTEQHSPVDAAWLLALQ